MLLIRSDFLFTDNGQLWKYEIEQDVSDTMVDGGDEFDMTGWDFQDHAVLNVGTFRRGLITEIIGKDNDDPNSSGTPCENLIDFNPTSKESPVTNVIGKQNLKKKYFCSQYPRVYMYLRGLKRHLEFECGKNFKFACPYCGRKCKRLDNCYHHIKNRHKNRPVYANELY